MTMVPIDVSSWGRRNLWRTPAGVLAVRPGLRTVLQYTGRYAVGGFSIRNDRVGNEVWHYLFHVTATAGVPLDLQVTIYDDQWVEFQTLSLGVDVIPRVVTHAVVFSHVVISSPDFPTLYGRVGVGLTQAAPVASVSGATVIDPIPRGICTAWNNRVVICDGRVMYVSDPIAIGGGDPRSFIGENASQRPGIIYGVHEGAGRMLVVVTSAGVYGLDTAASSVGIVGTNGASWQLLNHHEATSYQSSCVSKGRIFALTQDGFALVDIDEDAEHLLSDREMTRFHGEPIRVNDWRNARMFSGDDGPIISHDNVTGIGPVDDATDVSSAIYMHDVSSGFGSWWTSAHNLRIQGIMRDSGGSQLFIEKIQILKPIGDFDGSRSIDVGALDDQPQGVIFGAAPVIAHKNRDVRQVHVAAAITGDGDGKLYAALRGSSHSGTPVADSEGFVIGTDVWTAGKRIVSAQMSDVRVEFGADDCEPTREPTIEIAVDGCLSRMSETISIEDANGAESRPSKVG